MGYYSSNSKAIGIDLGTTYSCVGVWQDDHVEIIANDQGNRTTPSYVAFTNGERLFGDDAKKQASMNLNNTVFDVKRLIGRRFDDAQVQANMKHLPFKVVSKDKKPYIEVQHHGETKQFCPEEISSMVLLKMKKTAEAFLDTTVENAVIAVPAYFNDSQRQATKDAGRIAGLNVLRIINEPTAAAVAYGLGKNLLRERNVLIFDFGGGTLDVSLLTMKNGIFEVKATAGDAHLGGEDFDTCLVNFFIEEFKRKNKKDISSDPGAVRRLRAACEVVKRNLSSLTKTSIEIESLCDRIDFRSSITRLRFEELCQDLFKRTLNPVKKVLSESKIDKGNVHEIVMVGGSTRIPRVITLVSNFFNGKKLNKNTNPDEAVAYGAAVQAAILSGGTSSERTPDLVLRDVAPFDLNVETEAHLELESSETRKMFTTFHADVGTNIAEVTESENTSTETARRVDTARTTLIEHNTTIPTENTKSFSVYPGRPISILEGGSASSEDYNVLGRFKASSSQIDITLKIDADGILNTTVYAKNPGNTTSNKFIITKAKGRLSEEDIQRMRSELEEYEAEGEGFDIRDAAKNEFESFAYKLKGSLTDGIDKLCELRAIVDKAIEWLDETQDSGSKEKYEKKKMELEQTKADFVMTARSILEGLEDDEEDYTGRPHDSPPCYR
ncbi:heat shock protein 70 [Rhodocollybia butyracea]|uniref:Heat shock protein 70 n=1 Tax=Rhodocollybia butyracea TaxID=206335 RepID=A0A9P5U620_9AGAR|nr:heat shock protein 70 [Rhodocollybia butyracea]